MALAKSQADEKIAALQFENMRRSNKKRTTHLDLPSNEDHVDSTNNNKSHKHKGNAKSGLAVALLCGLAALGTLFYVSDKVFAPDTKKAMGEVKEATQLSHNPERFMSQQNRVLPPDSIYRTKVQDIHGDWQQLMKYSGGVSLIVNVACE